MEKGEMKSKKQTQHEIHAPIAYRLRNTQYLSVLFTNQCKYIVTATLRNTQPLSWFCCESFAIIF